MRLWQEGYLQVLERPSVGREIRFNAVYDAEAAVWVANSSDRITTEAPTRDELVSRLSVIVPDVLESRDEVPGPLRITVEWQELRTFDETTLAIA